MIRVTCPSCKTKFNAKDKLAGETRPCPRCGAMLHISESPTPITSGAEETVTVEDAPSGQRVHDAPEQELPHIAVPQRLARHNRYLILDTMRIIAVWEGDTTGWQVKTPAGLLPASRHPDKLPNEGHFTLVELKLHKEGAAVRLVGLECFKLVERYALTALGQGQSQDKILARVSGPGALAREQKSLVRQYLRDRFMHQVWAEAQAVLEYLGNADYHSHGVGAE